MRPDDPSGRAPLDVQALQAEVLRLRETLRTTLLEKDRVLRLLRNTNTDLHSRVQGQTRQLNALNHLITTINVSLNLREVAANALAGLHQLLGVEAAALALKDEQAWIQYFEVHPPALLPAVAAVRRRPGEGLLGQVIADGQTFFSNDLSTVSLTEHDAFPGLSLRSMVCQPLIARERVIGAVLLLNKWAGPFTDGDRAFIETVAGSLSVAVENARIYQEVQTQLRALEETHAQLVGAQAQLVQSARQASIGQIAAGLAHELNNPLGIILGFSQLIGQRATDDKLQDYAATIERETRRVQRLVSDLLGLARSPSEGDAAPDALTPVDLHALVLRAEQLLSYQLAQEGISLTVAAGGPNWVMGEADQLLQVVLNLIQNARQAMRGGGRLTLRDWTEAGRAHLSVADTGPGISAEDRAHIFDPFFTTKPPGEGVGLGLSVSASIVRRHGGEIRLVSEAGQGAEFVVSLPGVAGQPGGT